MSAYWGMFCFARYLWLNSETLQRMDDYMNYELATLVDLLAEKTEAYTHMMGDTYPPGENFAQVAEDILAIQRAILKKMGVEDPPEAPRQEIG